MKEVLLYSGGIDSLIAWYWLDKPETLYIDLEHRYRRKELDAIWKLPPRPRILDVGYGRWFERPDAYIPARNLLLGMCAAASGYDSIWLVAQAGEQSISDRSPKFFSQTSEVLTFHFGYPVEIKNPFPSMYKHDMVFWYLSEKLPVDDLVVNSTSCYSEQEGQCGECSSCFRKYAALEYNGVHCADVFRHDVVAWGREHYTNRLDEYDSVRQNVIKKVLGL